MPYYVATIPRPEPAPVGITESLAYLADINRAVNPVYEALQGWINNQRIAREGTCETSTD